MIQRLDSIYMVIQWKGARDCSIQEHNRVVCKAGVALYSRHLFLTNTKIYIITMSICAFGSRISIRSSNLLSSHDGVMSLGNYRCEMQWRMGAANLGSIRWFIKVIVIVR